MAARYDMGGKPQRATRRRTVTYSMQPLDGDASLASHRFGINRLLTFNKNEELLSAGRDGVVRRWDVAQTTSREPKGSAAPPRCVEAFVSHTDWVTDLAVAEDRILISSSYDGTIKLWDLQGARDSGGSGRAEARVAEVWPLATLAKHTDYVKCIAYAQDGGILVSGGVDCKLLLWDLRRITDQLVLDTDLDGGGGEPTQQLPLAGSSPPARGLLASPRSAQLRSKVVAVGPSDVILLHEGTRSTSCVDIDATGTLVAAGNTDHIVRLFDTRQAAPVCKLEGHLDVVRCVRLEAAGGAHAVVSGSSDKTLRRWDLRQQRCVGVFAPDGGPVWCMADGGSAAAVAPAAAYTAGSGGNVCCTDTREETGTTSAVIASVGRPVLALAVASVDGGAAGDNVAFFVGSTSSDLEVYTAQIRRVDATLAACSGVLDVPPETAAALLPPASSPASPSLDAATGAPAAAEASASSNGVAGMEVEDARGEPQPPALNNRAAAVADEVQNAEELEARYANAVAKLAEAAAARAGDPPLVDGRCCVAPGLPGIVRYKVLNDRRNLLTEDNSVPPVVSLWDAIAAVEIARFEPGTTLEKQAAALLQLVHARQWFSVDTRLGLPRITLSQTIAFAGEQFADDADAPPLLAAAAAAKPQGASEHSALAKDAMNVDAAHEPPKPSENGHADNSSAEEAAAAAAAASEVKINLGERALHGLFRVWLTRRKALLGSPRRRRPMRRDSDDSHDSDSSEEDDDEVPGRQQRRQGQQHQQEEGEQHGASGQEEGGGTAAGTSLDEQERQQLKQRQQRMSQDTVVWVTEEEEDGEVRLERVLLRQKVGTFTGHEAEDVLPTWVVDCVALGEYQPPNPLKVNFYLVPYPLAGTKPGEIAAAEETAQKLTAPALMRAHKVIAYIQSNDELKGQLRSHRNARSSDSGGASVGSGSGAGAGNSHPSSNATAPAGRRRHRDWRRRRTPASALEGDGAAASSSGDEEALYSDGGGGQGGNGNNGEEEVQLLCNGRVVDPSVSLGAVCYCIWEKATPMRLQFRAVIRGRPSAAPATAAAAAAVGAGRHR